ncbi:MAG: MBL fold metallo-hydrolase [Gammaproteobacteria bacterium]|nr:MBL fold metallo-hydrolase [Gammaproteobacteria bacterium]
MPCYEEYAHGIYCIDSGYVQDQYCAIYLLIEGDEVAIIETGTNHTVERVLSVLSELDINRQQIKYVIPTHIHLDHVGGASAMMALFPQARLIIHPRGARHVIDPLKLIEGSIAVYGDTMFRRLYGDIHPIEENRVDIAEDLSTFLIGQRELVFIDTPGHARHHFCIYDTKSNGIFCGDTFGISYPAMKHLPHGLMPSSSPVHFDAKALLQSIDRLIEYRPDYVYLTHFGRIENPVTKAISLKQWIIDTVDVCRTINPIDQNSTDKLEKSLREMAINKFGGNLDGNIDQILKVLSTDIRLNARGLAIWWQAGGYA